MKKNVFFTLVLFSLMANGVWAQESNEGSVGALITDRPTQTYSSFVVPKGVFQIESGIGYTRIDFPGNAALSNKFIMETFTLNFLQTRYGLSDKVELRLAQNVYVNRGKVGGDVVSNGDVQFAPTWIGAKFHILKEDGFVPQTSFLAEYVTDVFDENGGQDLMNLRLNFSNTLNEKLTLGYGLGGFVPVKNGTFNLEYSVVGSYAFEPEWAAFLELYGTFRSGFSSHNVDMGLSYLVNNNLQLDVYTGFDLTNNPGDTDFIFGLGFSTRILKK
ncbi:transporter [Roseivirga sp.]|uniref:transporter n=1 Tax=Roseivirga sp. TaxID=1964215 RepID=UPI002B270B04|nr:transporter [Roseivirga sp.]